ncbi:MAG: winged helix-turn-helix transcriptional regulator [Burkholderiales bacterium]|nr:winged helix-turn-helix transcriptional regulator [Burkholderiales bacterium]
MSKKVPPIEPALVQSPQAGEPATSVLRRFRIVFNAVKTHFQQVERRAGIGGAQVWALSVLKAQPGIGVSSLASAMDVHQSTASNLVKTLLEQGLATAGRSEHDRRVVQLRITPAGTRVLRRAPGPFAGVLPEALGALDPQTLRRLDRDLGKLIALLHADDRAGKKPLAQL